MKRNRAAYMREYRAKRAHRAEIADLPTPRELADRLEERLVGRDFVRAQLEISARIAGMTQKERDALLRKIAHATPPTR